MHTRKYDMDGKERKQLKEYICYIANNRDSLQGKSNYQKHEDQSIILKRSNIIEAYTENKYIEEVDRTVAMLLCDSYLTSRSKEDIRNARKKCFNKQREVVMSNVHIYAETVNTVLDEKGFEVRFSNVIAASFGISAKQLEDAFQYLCDEQLLLWCVPNMDEDGHAIPYAIKYSPGTIYLLEREWLSRNENATHNDLKYDFECKRSFGKFIRDYSLKKEEITQCEKWKSEPMYLALRSHKDAIKKYYEVKHYNTVIKPRIIEKSNRKTGSSGDDWIEHIDRFTSINMP